eukprot:TRINITY_DN76246_c0_g1_i1.p1 TRINITY_DN76246_c0_g1~~TRINITY_DN76246_c0_g1_i1.p1  ORF type:complete len:550 (-),score=86.25 TRINITY_DN76246_c0_g1_i1:298-1947(-)
MRRGNCFRCGRYGHFARECYGERSSVPSGPSGSGPNVYGNPSLFGCASPQELKPDPKKTTTWNLPGENELVNKRNHKEFLILLTTLWESGLIQLVRMLFLRFGNQVLPAEGPSDILDSVPLQGDLTKLAELEFQLGRRAEVHFNEPTGEIRKEFIIDPQDAALPPEVRDHKVRKEDLLLFSGEKNPDSFRGGWWHENGSRYGLPGTLHRVSGISGRHHDLIGVIIRVGRTVEGTVEKMLPSELRRSASSILLVGPPNSGKTTVLREFARMLSDQDNKVVVVVDKTSEIAGASNEPHPAIGESTRWMPVDKPQNQHAYMRQAVENLSPDTIVVDEISTDSECDAAKTISQRGVQLVATVHGKSLVELVNDQHRSSLLGGVTSVTLSKQEVEGRMSRGGSAQKQVMMRKYEPLFGLVVELHSRELWYVHRDPREAVDAYLRREPVLAWRATPGKLEQVVAHPEEGGFRYEPEMPASASSSSARRQVKLMSEKCKVDPRRVQAMKAQATPSRAPGPSPKLAAVPQVASYAAPDLASEPWMSESLTFQFGSHN